MHKRMPPHGDFDHIIDITYVLTTQYQLERTIGMDIQIKKF